MDTSWVFEIYYLLLGIVREYFVIFNGQKRSFHNCGQYCKSVLPFHQQKWHSLKGRKHFVTFSHTRSRASLFSPSSFQAYTKIYIFYCQHCFKCVIMSYSYLFDRPFNTLLLIRVYKVWYHHSFTIWTWKILLQLLSSLGYRPCSIDYQGKLQWTLCSAHGSNVSDLSYLDYIQLATLHTYFL